MNVWIMAMRPKTLVAGIAPVVLGSALAYMHGAMQSWMLPFLVLSSVLIQIASNFINDVEDFKRGADAQRVGPTRAVSAGLITPKSMQRASMIVIALAFMIGLPLVFATGPIVLVIGVLSLIMSWAYTGGPYPLAYKGLGDVFAFVFFGVIACAGTFFVHTSSWSMDAFMLSVLPGAMAANILGVNNMRDIETDAIAGKHTLAVRMGLRAARVMYFVLLLAAVCIPPFYLAREWGPWLCLPLTALPMAALLITMVNTRTGARLNPALGATAGLYLFLTVLMIVGMILGSSEF